MESKVTLILGASTKPERISYQAIHRLRESGHSVIAIGNAEGQVGDVPIQKGPIEGLPRPHTVSIYLQPKWQEVYRDGLLALKPQRVIFNPGTENPTLATALSESGISFEHACTLVLLSTDQY